MKVIDELERLSKEATPGRWMPCGDILRNASAIRTETEDLFCSYDGITMKTADNAKLIATMRNNIDALIQVARAAEYLLDHVNRDYAEWKEPLEKALEKLK